MRQRAFGLFILALGLVIVYLAIYLPLVESAAGGAGVKLSLKAILICPVPLFLGLLYTVLGPRAEDIIGTREHPSDFSYAIGVMLIVLGVFVYLFLSEVVAQGR